MNTKVKLQKIVDVMKCRNVKKNGDAAFESKRGFTIVEVIIAASIMIVLCVGTLTVYSYVIKINAGNNLRSQALTVLQAEAEYYRSLKFVPYCGATATELEAGNHTRPQRLSKDGTPFNIMVTIVNYPYGDPPLSDNCITRLKEIKIEAKMANRQSGWLYDMKTDLTLLRVRSN